MIRICIHIRIRDFIIHIYGFIYILHINIDYIINTLMLHISIHAVNNIPIHIHIQKVNHVLMHIQINDIYIHIPDFSIHVQDFTVHILMHIHIHGVINIQTHIHDFVLCFHDVIDIHCMVSRNE